MSESTVQLAAWAPFLALAGALVNGLFGRWLKEPWPGLVATLAMAAAFVLGLIALLAFPAGGEAVRVSFGGFLSAGDFNLGLGFHIDQLSLTMVLIITGIGLLIHLYSIGYLHADDGFARYFAQLNLFSAAMLVLVLADSFPLMFVGWEGVGVCSYLLIGFWYQELENTDAGRKAFIVNRVGDVGFLLAMFLTFKQFGSLDIATVTAALSSPAAAGALAVGGSALTLIGLLYLLAAAGKSAQLPLQVWLPDAMAGPTPVSALIHAATMVTAGVYLIARTGAIFAAAPEASATVAWIGALTALLAAAAAFSQTDIKRILAYSTISQVGFMIAAVGAGAYWVGIFHVLTHAFFKALLFLAAGSVIHALDGEQDIRRMGGLGRQMRLTGITALIGTLAIAGVPLLAGFFSKDAILSHVLGSGLLAGRGAEVLYGLLLITAALTACYMFRWYYQVFAGEPRAARGQGAKAAPHRAHESPAVMTLPLVVLAAGSLGAGYLGLPEFLSRNRIAEWLEPVTAAVPFRHFSLSSEWLLVAASVVASALGLAAGYWFYAVNKGAVAKRLEGGLLARASRAAFGFDALYRGLFIRPLEGAAQGAEVLDRDLLDRGITGGGASVGLLARLITLLQSGSVRGYALTMLLGIAVLAAVAGLSGVLR